MCSTYGGALLTIIYVLNCINIHSGIRNVCSFEGATTPVFNKNKKENQLISFLYETVISANVGCSIQKTKKKFLPFK